MLGSSPHKKQHQLLGDYSGDRVDIFGQYDIQLFFYSWLAQILHSSKRTMSQFSFHYYLMRASLFQILFFPQTRRALQLLLNVKIMHSLNKNVKQYGKRHKDKSKINPTFQRLLLIFLMKNPFRNLLTHSDIFYKTASYYTCCSVTYFSSEHYQHTLKVLLRARWWKRSI